MKVSIKDKSKNIARALGMLGYRVKNVDVEVILNVAEFVAKKGDETTMKELIEIQSMTEDLFKE